MTIDKWEGEGCAFGVAALRISDLVIRVCGEGERSFGSDMLYITTPTNAQQHNANIIQER